MFSLICTLMRAMSSRGEYESVGLKAQRADRSDQAAPQFHVARDRARFEHGLELPRAPAVLVVTRAARFPR